MMNARNAGHCTHGWTLTAARGDRGDESGWEVLEVGTCKGGGAARGMVSRGGGPDGALDTTLLYALTALIGMSDETLWRLANNRDRIGRGLLSEPGKLCQAVRVNVCRTVTTAIKSGQDECEGPA